MKKFKIFVSAVQNELKIERRAVKNFVTKDVLLSEYFDVFLFDDSSARSKSAKNVYLEEVRKSDIYLGILGMTDGNALKGQTSPVEAEYREAVENGKEILIYIKGTSDQDKNREVGIQGLIKEIRNPDHGFSYKRFADAAELTNAVHESLIDFLKEKGIVGRDSFDERVCYDASLSDVDKKKVQRFLATAKDKRNLSPMDSLSLSEVMTHLDLLRKGKLTNAAVLLFGKEPHRFFLQAEIKCLHLDGTEIKKPFLSYKVYSGDLFEQVEKAVAFVAEIIRQPVVQREDTPRFKRPLEIPIFAIQEAIVNAVAHRSYNVTSGVQVMVFADRIEVWNPGSLPPQLTLEDLKKPHTSYPSNPLLANVLYLGDYIQKVGSGTLEMIKQCRTHGVPDPEFQSVRNKEFRAVLPRDVFTQPVLERFGLNERQMKAVMAMKVSLRIDNSGYRQLTGATRKTAARDLDELVKKGLLERKGARRGAHYVLRSKLEMRHK